VATFDLQAVLQTPCTLVSQIYYMRNLSCYNLSIYNLASKHATCYLWTAVDAKRGSCEIGTCLYLHLLSLQRSIKHAIFYSDACSGQNRNCHQSDACCHKPSTHRKNWSYISQEWSHPDGVWQHTCRHWICEEDRNICTSYVEECH
jgi:hypothetical protein